MGKTASFDYTFLFSHIGTGRLGETVSEKFIYCIALLGPTAVHSKHPVENLGLLGVLETAGQIFLERKPKQGP